MEINKHHEHFTGLNVLLGAELLRLRIMEAETPNQGTFIYSM